MDKFNALLPSYEDMLNSNKPLIDQYFLTEELKEIIYIKQTNNGSAFDIEYCGEIGSSSILVKAEFYLTFGRWNNHYFSQLSWMYIQVNKVLRQFWWKLYF